MLTIKLELTQLTAREKFLVMAAAIWSQMPVSGHTFQVVTIGATDLFIILVDRLVGDADVGEALSRGPRGVCRPGELQQESRL